MRALVIVVLSSLGLVLPSLAAAQAAPPEGAWLRYRYEQRLVGGGGAYLGYSESTDARARYEIVAVGDLSVTIRGRYAWRYSSPERSDSGAEDRTVAFSRETRRYLDRRTDVSDLDSQDGRELATWIWIPPDVTPSSTVRILDQDFEVTATGATVVAADAPRQAIELVSRSTGSRDDEYGQLTTSIVDRYWYDAATGMFLKEVHEETATGTLEGETASFRLVTTITLVDSSYAPSLLAPPEDDYTGFPAPTPPYTPRSYDYDYGRRDDTLCFVIGIGMVVLPLLVVVVVLVRRKRRRRPTTTATGELFQVRRLREPSLPSAPSEGSLFTPFIPHMIRVAQAAKYPVAIATGQHGRLLGVAIGDDDAAIGTIFAPDSDVCEALRGEIKQSEFFSEVRHPKLASVARLNLTAPTEAYNVYETYEVMVLRSRPPDLGYDTDLISPMKDAERPAVVALLQQVYGVPCERWLGASLDQGDLAWVAHEGDRIIGVAMATVVGDQARLHALTVHPDHRARGLGTALYRARLRALFDMGVASVLTECATWNVAALELARSHGFEKAGVMYVESARHQRDERKLVRR